MLLTACTTSSSFDPVTSDVIPFDGEFPPLISETIFRVDGAGLNAIVYEAQGPGPHPTAILLHGFPGNEKNLDIAQAIRRAGWNVVFFHYRGSWGSGGLFSFEHVLEDVADVVEAISEPAFGSIHRVDPDRIALIGHSMGGFAALVSGSEIERVDCVVSMAGANLGGLAKRAARSSSETEGMAAHLDGWSGPIKGRSGAELIAEIAGDIDRFDTTTHASVLAGKRLLLIAGRRDQVTPVALHHDPLVEGLEAERAVSLESEVFENADHSFSGQRIRLTRRVTRWLETSCLPLE
jgi:pimeloyl-ACP methyl ester carboxylesterase